MSIFFIAAHDAMITVYIHIKMHYGIFRLHYQMFQFHYYLFVPLINSFHYNLLIEGPRAHYLLLPNLLVQNMGENLIHFHVRTLKR